MRGRRRPPSGYVPEWSGVTWYGPDASRQRAGVATWRPSPLRRTHMSPRLDRRNFLKLGTFTAVAVALPGCGKSEKTPSEPETVDKVFPQGVASGDPRPDKITLWT